MDLGKGQRVRLEPQDEYMHPVESAPNFNESMYINLFDHQQKTGGWFRVGNRPNEGYAEMSCCIYLPDGRVGFMFKRPRISNNDALDAAGMKFEVIEPLKQLKVTYQGPLCLLSDPAQMEDPKTAFANNPQVEADIELMFTAIAPVYGGEAVDENDQPIEEAPDESFARAHYEQHMGGSGTLQVGKETLKIDGFGLRDHSWGPRYWQNLYWYRWLPMVFTENFAINVSIVTMANGRQHIWGMVLEGDHYKLLEDASLETRYDENQYPQDYVGHLRTADNEYRIEGRVLSQIPLRNRRTKDNGETLNTRIIEGFTEFQCNGMTGYGMTEYLDQIVDGRPVGMPQ